MQKCLPESVLARTTSRSTRDCGTTPVARAGSRNVASSLSASQQQHNAALTSNEYQHLPCSAAGSSKRQLLQAGIAAILMSAAGSWQRRAAVAGGCQLQSSSSGLQWCDIVVGDGALPIKGAFTKAHYTATLQASGTPFDSSYRRKQPLIFKAGEREVIEAWDVGILGSQDIPPMHEGGKRLIVAPPGPLQKQGTKSLVWVVGLSEALAEAGLELSPEGAPTSALMFEIELLKKRGNRA